MESIPLGTCKCGLDTGGPYIQVVFTGGLILCRLDHYVAMNSNTCTL